MRRILLATVFVTLGTIGGSTHVARGAGFGQTLTGPNPQIGSVFGVGLALGEVNGDGIPDVISSASLENGAYQDEGRVYVFDGATGTHLRTIQRTSPAYNDVFGGRIAVGDVTGDGIVELVAGGYSPTEIYSLQTGAFITTLPTIGTLAMADFDGDTKADVVVGSEEDFGGLSDAGRVYIYSGATGSLIRALDPPDPQTGAYFGQVLATGDFDGNGTTDLGVGVPRFDTGWIDQGRIYLFSDGNDVVQPLVVNSPSGMTEMYGTSFGSAVAIGDANGDSAPEIAVASSAEDVSGIENQGRTYIFSGVTGQQVGIIEAPNPQRDGYFGGVAMVDDADGDGQREYVIGAAMESVGGEPQQGRVYFFSGIDKSLTATIESPAPETGFPNVPGFGAHVVAAPKSLGGTLFAVSAPGAGFEAETIGNTMQGRVYLFDTDQDSDGVIMTADNCPSVSNVGQGDEDGDGAGDACEAAGSGNVDCSDAVNSVDALKVLRHSAALSVAQEDPCADISSLVGGGRLQGDTNCSGSVNSVDALLVLRKVAALPVVLPGGCPPIAPP